MNMATFEIRGWHVLVMIVAFFATIIGVNVTFAVLAVQSFPGEDVQRSYLQGLHYNSTLAERREQAALGWRATTQLRSDNEGVALVVTMNDHDTSPIEGAMLTGELEWPTNSQLDRALTFESQGGGRYVARLNTLAVGRWRLRARAERGADALDFESELTWPTR